jgi:hypothetical protein
VKDEEKWGTGICIKYLTLKLTAKLFLELVRTAHTPLNASKCMQV